MCCTIELDNDDSSLDNDDSSLGMSITGWSIKI
jgi:hypothetical protein